MEQLLSAFRQGNVILFVGAGVSMNLGLPSWSTLLDKIAKDLGYEPEIYKSFGDHYALAEYYRLQKGSIGPLRSWMDRVWHSPDIDISTSKVHEYIAKANFPIIYTTNYDRWIEHALAYYGKPFTKIASVSDFTRIKSDKVQVVKFHGDFDDDKSIVIDETSYFERLEFETPLDIKLRSDVLGKSVLFIGYSWPISTCGFYFTNFPNYGKPTGRVMPSRNRIFSRPGRIRYKRPSLSNGGSA
ncbi:SIR2 family protein [Aeromonas caviae]|uniref:SIR2 family protein n=1 Tax=Aeromonas caviae TaxID=648 RepID=UPI003F7A64E1